MSDWAGRPGPKLFADLLQDLEGLDFIIVLSSVVDIPLSAFFCIHLRTELIHEIALCHIVFFLNDQVRDGNNIVLSPLPPTKFSLTGCSWETTVINIISAHITASSHFFLRCFGFDSSLKCLSKLQLKT